MLKRTVMALAIAGVAYVGVAQAQVQATLTLKSGERISGQLVDMGGTGFTIRVDNQQREIPTNDVAVIDFAGGGTMTAADWAKIGAGQQVAFLTSGEMIQGNLYDIGGTTPLRLTFRTAAGERNLTSNEVSRIVLARPETAPPVTAGTTGATAGPGGGIVVPATQQWTATGLNVRRGEELMFNATGEIRLNESGTLVAVPAGVQTPQKAGTGAPMPGELAGALIGRIGPNGQPFGIGNLESVRVPASGQLFLGINDAHLADNAGEFRVEITRRGVRR